VITAVGAHSGCSPGSVEGQSRHKTAGRQFEWTDRSAKDANVATADAPGKRGSKPWLTARSEARADPARLYPLLAPLTAGNALPRVTCVAYRHCPKGITEFRRISECLTNHGLAQKRRQHEGVPVADSVVKPNSGIANLHCVRVDDSISAVIYSSSKPVQRTEVAVSVEEVRMLSRNRPVAGIGFRGLGLPGTKLLFPVEEVCVIHAYGATGPIPACLSSLTNSLHLVTRCHLPTRPVTWVGEVVGLVRGDAACGLGEPLEPQAEVRVAVGGVARQSS
jgi:hypothetical protein